MTRAFLPYKVRRKQLFFFLFLSYCIFQIPKSAHKKHHVHILIIKISVPVLRNTLFHIRMWLYWKNASATFSFKYLSSIVFYYSSLQFYCFIPLFIYWQVYRETETATQLISLSAPHLLLFWLFLKRCTSKIFSCSKLSKTGTSTVIQKTSSENLSSDIVKNQIGFQTPLSTSPQTGDRFSPPPELSAPTSSYLKTRIYIVSGIGLLSLIILVFARHTPSVTPELAATVSQLRDFVASCIGFLISCGKQSNE